MSAGHRWVRRLVTATTVALALLVASELALRIAFPGLHDTETLRASGDEARLGRYRQRSMDDALYFEMKPGLDIRFGESSVRTDAKGLRVRDVLEAAAPPPRELVVLGDSTSFGWRVEWDDSYPARVCSRLEQAWGVPVHLTNRSVPGYNSEQELHVLQRDVLSGPRPTLILWHVDHNDANAALESYQPVQLDPAWGDNALGSALVKALRRALRLRELESRLHEQQPHARLDGYVTSGPLWERHVTALLAGARAAQQAGVPLRLVLFDCDVMPDSASAHVDSLHVPLKARLAAAGVELLDLHPALEAHARGQGWTSLEPFWLAPDDPHPNAAGHELIAGLVAADLLTRFPTPPGSPR